MALKPKELQQIKNVMGYGNITSLALPYIDVALVFETVIQNNVDAFGEDKIRDLLPKIEQLEQDIFDARTKYVVSELVGEVKINDRHHQKLVELREWEIDRLAETVRVPRAKMKAVGGTCEVT